MQEVQYINYSYLEICYASYLLTLKHWHGKSYWRKILKVTAIQVKVSVDMLCITSSSAENKGKNTQTIQCGTTFLTLEFSDDTRKQCWNRKLGSKIGFLLPGLTFDHREVSYPVQASIILSVHINIYKGCKAFLDPRLKGEKDKKNQDVSDILSKYDPKYAQLCSKKVVNSGH